MTTLIINAVIVSEIIILIMAFFMHLVRQNRLLVILYSLQSFSVASVLLVLAMHEHSWSLGISVLFTVIIKVVSAPTLLLRLIERHNVQQSASTYLTLPFTLLVLLVLMIGGGSSRFAPLASLTLYPPVALLSALGSLLVSLFLIINRKGVLSQMVGVLSVENSVVAVALLLPIQHSASLEFGIAFTTMVWVVIAVTFIGFIHRHFGTHDTRALSHLTE